MFARRDGTDAANAAELRRALQAKDQAETGWVSLLSCWHLEGRRMETWLGSAKAGCVRGTSELLDEVDRAIDRLVEIRNGVERRLFVLEMLHTTSGSAALHDHSA